MIGYGFRLEVRPHDERGRVGEVLLEPCQRRVELRAAHHALRQDPVAEVPRELSEDGPAAVAGLVDVNERLDANVVEPRRAQETGDPTADEGIDVVGLRVRDESRPQGIPRG
jgi:hypothetical protein